MRLRDLDVRRALHKKVLDEHHEDPNTLVLDELGLWFGTARIDVAVVNGRIHGYEIKSDRDTLDRLAHQVCTYGKVLDRVTLVVGLAHHEEATKSVPDWWGIKLASAGPRGGVHFEDVRSPSKNPEIDPVAIAALLWKDELVAVLQRYGAAKGAHRKTRLALTQLLAATLELTVLRATVRETLKVRTGWRSDQRRS